MLEPIRLEPFGSERYHAPKVFGDTNITFLNVPEDPLGWETRQANGTISSMGLPDEIITESHGLKAFFQVVEVEEGVPEGIPVGHVGLKNMRRVEELPGVGRSLVVAELGIVLSDNRGTRYIGPEVLTKVMEIGFHRFDVSIFYAIIKNGLDLKNPNASFYPINHRSSRTFRNIGFEEIWDQALAELLLPNPMGLEPGEGLFLFNPFRRRDYATIQASPTKFPKGRYHPR